jgi:hypothetical protein
MSRVCVLVPFALDEQGLANRRLQQQSVKLGPDIEFDYKGVKAGPALYDSYHDYILADLSMFDAGLDAADEGYDAICIDTMSDSGANALRSMLDIPVITPGKASSHRADARKQVLGADPVGRLDPALHEGLPGVRADLLPRVDPLDQHAAGR